MTDSRDGSMTSVTGELPPLQAEVYAIVPVGGGKVPLTGVPSAIIRALVERKLIRVWKNGTMWRRESTGGGVVSLVCFRGKDGRRWAEVIDTTNPRRKVANPGGEQGRSERSERAHHYTPV